LAVPPSPRRTHTELRLGIVSFMICRRLVYCVALSAGLLSGCATYEHRLLAVRGEYFSNDLTAATQTIDEAVKKNGNDADVLKLERSIVELVGGKPKDAERTLREVRDRFDHLEQKSLAESALSMLSDDNRKSYAGEDYEKVLIRAF